MVSNAGLCGYWMLVVGGSITFHGPQLPPNLVGTQWEVKLSNALINVSRNFHPVFFFIIQKCALYFLHNNFYFLYFNKTVYIYITVAFFTVFVLNR